MKITQDHLDMVKKMGACKNRLLAYKAGDTISKVQTSDLIWVENHDRAFAKSVVASIPKPKNSLKGKPPLWVYGSGAGYGDGSGYGYGSGDGSGYGYGHGAGYGYGSGVI